MSRSERGNLTVGEPGKKLLAFALPIILINFLQAIYNVADMVILGHFAGADGMSAVSIGGQVTNVVLVVAVAISNGGVAMTGQSFGRGEHEGIRRILSTMNSLLLALALGLTALVLLACRPILTFLNTPAESFSGAVAYLCICMAGTVFVYTYNCFYAILRGIGDSVSPLRIVSFTMALNIVLDLVFVAVLHTGAAGAAAATVISQALSALLICRTVCRAGYFRFEKQAFGFDRAVLNRLMKISTPQVIQMVLTNTSFLLVGGLVNAFGVYHSAAAGAVAKLWNFTVLAGQAMMTAMISMCAQNYARQEYGRILRALGTGIGVVSAIAAVITLLCELWPAQMLGLFTDEQDVIAAGIRYLRWFAVGFIAENIMFCLFGTLTGAGHTVVPMCCAVITAYLIRYLFAFVLSRHTPLGFEGIAAAYSAAPFVSTGICGVYLASGRWKQSRN